MGLTVDVVVINCGGMGTGWMPDRKQPPWHACQYELCAAFTTHHEIAMPTVPVQHASILPQVYQRQLLMQLTHYY